MRKISKKWAIIFSKNKKKVLKIKKLSRTKSLSPESLAKRTAKVRNPREERNYGHDNNRKRYSLLLKHLYHTYLMKIKSNTFFLENEPFPFFLPFSVFRFCFVVDTVSLPFPFCSNSISPKITFLLKWVSSVY